MNPQVRKAIAGIDWHAWATIRYPQAIWEETEQRWISDAQVASRPVHRLHLPPQSRARGMPADRATGEMPAAAGR
jgi:hypothetical protein